MSKVVLVTGHGLLGCTIFDYCSKNNLYNYVFIDKKYSNLKNYQQTLEIFDNFRPQKVIHTAAKVGGVGAHKGLHHKFLEENCLININVLKACQEYKVKTLLAISSVAAYPYNYEYLTEDNFIIAPPHEAEFGYSLSKILLDSHIQLVRQELGLNYCAVTPVNIYGKNDKFDLKNGHVIACLIKKIFEAKKNNTDLVVWGTGNNIRQFIFVDDFAEILVKLLDITNLPPRLLIAHPQKYSIRQIVDILVKITNFQNKIIYDDSQPKGLECRECNISLLQHLIGTPKTNLEDGLKQTYEWYKNIYT